MHLIIHLIICLKHFQFLPYRFSILIAISTKPKNDISKDSVSISFGWSYIGPPVGRSGLDSKQSYKKNN